MVFETEKNKLSNLFKKAEQNTNAIITQKDNNNFIIDNINGLNEKNTTLSVLANFSSDWITPNVLFRENDSEDPIVDGNFSEFRLIFNNVPENFLPYIQCDVIYRSSQSGNIPTVNNPFGADIDFDEEIGQFDRLVTNEIFQINETNVEYISFIRMDFFPSSPQEIEYKFICNILNPHYYQNR